MWVAMWLFCTTQCQLIEEIKVIVFPTREVCEEYARQTAVEMAKFPGVTQVGYKCVEQRNS